MDSDTKRGDYISLSDDAKALEDILRTLDRVNQGPLRARDLSLAITHTEDGLLRLNHYLSQFPPQGDE